MRAVLAMIVVALCSGCTQEGPSSDQPAMASSRFGQQPTDQKPATVPEHMGEHFVRALQIKDAIIAGRLADVRERAKWMAEHGAPAGIPDSWIVHVTELRQLAAGIDEATTLAEAAEFLGRVAVVCARCHRGHQTKIVIAMSPQPEAGSKGMLVHAWATDRLWEGVILPSSAHWKRGIEALLGSPLLANNGDDMLPLRDAAKIARAADNDLDRGIAFSQIIATCASCHQDPINEKLAQ